MQLLVQHGADVRNSRGTPWSSRSRATDLRDDSLPSRVAAFHGHLEAVKWLYEQGMTANEVGGVLVAAAKGGRVLLIQTLIQECGADVSLYGPKAMQAAFSNRHLYGHLDVVCLLLEAGTPTTWAASAPAMQQCLKRYSREQLGTIWRAATQHGNTRFAGMLRGMGATRSEGGV
jgi:hypothetical protein